MPDISSESRSTAETTTLRPVTDWWRWAWHWVRRIRSHVWAIALRTDSDHVYMYAAGIAFNIITSLVPTILLILFVLGYVLDSAAIMQELNRVAHTYIVAEGFREDILVKLQSQIDILIRNRGLAGVIGAVGLLWSASALASSIRVAINSVLRCREVRGYLIYKLYDFMAIMMIGMLVFLSIITGPILQLVLAAGDKVGQVIHLSQLESLLSFGVNFVVTLLLFLVMFRYMPYQRQERHIILIGTLTSAALWELAHYIFSIYITEFNSFGRVYGTYAFFAAAALWIYVSSLVFLIGAEVAYHVKQSRWNARRMFEKASRAEA
ncbi:MAG TPA: YihY/virulence factor BrkB family protein [Candidatus Kapabacteria bacterium]|nr:YihY/virulence factor BrkB family protein [Candidatus Kapabacteria bacterium]